jgi:hypothetical protein
MKQTAVEWLSEQFDNILELYPSQFEKINNAITQAKEMEKQQIIDAYIDGYSATHYNVDSEQYYKETFNKP